MTGGSEHALHPARANPHATFARLFALYFREVWGWLAALGVGPCALREAVREVFIEAWSRLGEVGEATAVRAWLFPLATRVARAQRARAFQSPADGEATINRLLAPLTEPERVTFLLFELGGLPIAQIAELTGAAPAVVATHLRLARARGVDHGAGDDAPDPRRLLSPTAHTPRPLRVALQAALPPLPSARDEDEVESAVVDAIAARADGARPSGISRRERNL